MTLSPEITSLEIYEPLPLPLVHSPAEFSRVINALDSDSFVDTASLVKSSSNLSLDLKRSLLFEPSYAPPPPPQPPTEQDCGVSQTKATWPQKLHINKATPTAAQQARSPATQAPPTFAPPSKRASIYAVDLKRRCSQVRGFWARQPRAAKPRLERALAALPHALSRLSLQPRKVPTDRTQFT